MTFTTVATVQRDDDGRRCDRIFRAVLGKMPLGRIYKEIRSGFLRINGKRVKLDAHVSTGDTVDVAQSLLEFVQHPEPDRPARTVNRAAFKKRIVYEDDDILVLNKRKGELVHPGSGGGSFTTLDQLVKEYLDTGKAHPVAFSPGPLHRLDRNTSGLVAFGKNAAGARVFSSALQNREAHKCYIALLDGELGGRETWKDNLVRDEKTNTSRTAPWNGSTGAPAVTVAAPFLVSGGHTLAQVEIRTGRTHQIRCQAYSHRHPLTGDAKYHGSPNPGGYYLHSCCIIAGGRAITALPGAKFTAAVAGIMQCTEQLVAEASEKIIAAFIARNQHTAEKSVRMAENRVY